MNELLVITAFEDSTIIFTLVFLTLALQMIGLFSKFKIFCFFSIGGYITLMIQFSDSIGLLLIFIGIIIFNIYYAVFGDN